MFVVVVYNGNGVDLFGLFPDKNMANLFVRQRGLAGRFSIQEITPGVIQVRTDFVRPVPSTRAFPFDGMFDLYREIQSVGKVIEPLDCVRLVNGFYRCHSGFRRLMCAIALGLPTVPVRVIG